LERALLRWLGADVAQRPKRSDCLG